MDDGPGDGQRPESPGLNTSGPKIIRPIPRRPFKLAFSTPTPPDDDDEYTSPRPQITASDLRFLAPHQHAAVATPRSDSGSQDGSNPISHTTSLLNLTAPALYGIYSPSTLGSSSLSREDEEEPDQDYFREDADRGSSFGSSGGGGADTPLDSPGPLHLDRATEELRLLRSSLLARKGNSFMGPAPVATGVAAVGKIGGGSRAAPSLLSRRQERKQKQRTGIVAVQLVLRAALLFVLGVGYGVLVTRLPQKNSRLGQHQSSSSNSGTHRLTTAPTSIDETSLEWRYLMFWGVAGVALGTLLPWFDRFWEETVAARREKAANAMRSSSTSNTQKSSSIDGPDIDLGTDTNVDLNPDADADLGADIEPPQTTPTSPPPADWTLVIRGIGAFVGIAFAIRRLPWASTMQVSLTLALANPFLWYLIDRSKPGFLLSAAVGLVGASGVLVAGVVRPLGGGDGAGSLLRVGGSGGYEGVWGFGGNDNHTGLSSSSSSFVDDGSGGGTGGRGLPVGLETIETSIWMLSVLFCSCVCFGNIGRRLVLGSAAAGRGRWGGVR
ncbi:insulin-induced protein-domain-containing protein [Chaetomium sp. MPI-SDFR-AT-0129]|nr:insulin-induced protein-domain-containing protein [Chaetomium sp. MPI-SDFR-AT-0129]